MLEGKKLWDKEITEGLYEKTISDGTTIEIYKEIPDSLYEALEKTARHLPDHPAITDHYGRNYTYQDFLERCGELAAYLYWERGVCQGSHVGLLMHTCFEFGTAFFALNRLGAVAVLLPGKFERAEILPLAEKAEIDLIICDQDYAKWFDGVYPSECLLTVSGIEDGYGFREAYEGWTMLRKERQIEELRMKPYGTLETPAILMFTSGTTSMSKGVVLKNYNVMHAVESYRRILHITEKDISVIAAPIYHVTGLVALLGLFVHAGGHLYLHKFFDAKRVVKEARQYGFTFIHASPTIFNLLLQAGENTPEISGLRSFACGSSNMPKEKLTEVHRWLPKSRFHTVYGLTETSSPAAIFPDDAALSERIGSSGRPIPGTRFKIVDDDGKELLPGQVGEVAISGTVVLSSYYKQDSENLKGGWLYTGDLGYMTDDHYLYIVDRKKNMINRGGEKIWCYDVENELAEIEGIQDSAVVGIPDELYGEVAAAVVRLKAGCTLTEQEIQKRLRTRMAGYKIPVKIKMVDCVPQTANGKTDKRKIRSLLMEEDI